MVREQLAELLEKGYIVPSASPFGAAVMCIPKPGQPGKFRMVIDYRRLNALTVADRFPLPDIQELIDDVGTQGFKTTIYIPNSSENRYGGGFTQGELADNYHIDSSWGDYKFQKTHGHKHYRRFRPSWLQAIMWSHDEDELECSVSGCNSAAQEGAHLENKEIKLPPTYLVVPICTECHQPSKLSNTRTPCLIKDQTLCIEDSRDWNDSIPDDYDRLFQCPKCEKEWLWKKIDWSGYCFVCEDHFQEGEMPHEEDIE